MVIINQNHRLLFGGIGTNRLGNAKSITGADAVYAALDFIGSAKFMDFSPTRLKKLDRKTPRIVNLSKIQRGTFFLDRSHSQRLHGSRGLHRRTRFGEDCRKGGGNWGRVYTIHRLAAFTFALKRLLEYPKALVEIVYCIDATPFGPPSLLDLRD
jgi:hypothetical protein